MGTEEKAEEILHSIISKKTHIFSQILRTLRTIMRPGQIICVIEEGAEIKSGGMEELFREIMKMFCDSRERDKNPNQKDLQAQIK